MNGGTTTSRPSAATTSPGGSHALTDARPACGLLRRVGQGLVGHRAGAQQLHRCGRPGPGQGANIDLTASGVAGLRVVPRSLVHSILWRLNSQVGFKPINDTLTSAAFKNGVAVTSIHPFTAAFGVAAPGSVSVLNSACCPASRSAPPRTIPSASTKRTMAPSPCVLLDVPAGTPSAARTPACVTREADAAGAGNKLGSYVYLRFAAAKRSGAYTITVTGGRPPPIRISCSTPGGAVRRKPRDLRRHRDQGSVSLPAGDNVLVINDYNNSSANLFQRHHPAETAAALACVPGAGPALGRQRGRSAPARQ